MPTQERAVRTRQLLVRAAAETFERHGYVQAKLADISAGAGVSSGALHFHFRSKAAVASAVEACAGAELRREARLVQHSGANALQRLTDTSHVLAGLLRRDVVARAGFRLSHETPRGSGPTLPEEWQACVHRLLAEARKESLLVEGAEHVSVGDSIVAATTGFEMLGRQDPAWFSATTLTAFWRLLLPCLARPETLRGLRPTGPPAPAAKDRSRLG